MAGADDTGSLLAEIERLRARVGELESAAASAPAVPAALDDRAVARELEHRLKLEQLVANVSRRFIGCEAESVDNEIDRTLSDLGSFSMADRCYVLRICDDGERFSNTHEWCAEGVSPQIGLLQKLSVRELAWAWDTMLAGKVFHVPNVAELPADAQAVRDILEVQEIRSLVIVPLNVGGQISASLGLDRVKTQQAWSQDDIRLLRTVADIVASAMLRQRFEQALRSSEQKFFSVFASSPDIIAISQIDDARLMDVNPAFERILGFERHEAIGRSAVELGIWEAPGDCDRVIAQVRSQGIAHNLEARFRTLSGRKIDVLVSAGAVRIGDRECILAIARDVTARKLAEQEIRDLNAVLESRVAERTAALAESLRELESFSYSVSHDLRTPLRGINGYSHLLLEDYGAQLDDRGHDYVHRICAATQRMGELIDDLLTLAQISRTDLDARPVDLALLAREILAELRQIEPERKVEIVIATAAPTRGDPTLLRILLENLLGNAWKFTARSDSARIEFGVRQYLGQNQFFVRDNGVGFDRAFAHKLFQPFQRLHRLDDFPGSGVGLATVSRIAARHGGRAWAEGEPGAGATFYFTLG
jgi:PAS domain S-box-containing protein